MGYRHELPPVSTEAEPGTLVARDDTAGFRGAYQEWGPADPTKAVDLLEHNFLVTSSSEMLSAAAPAEITGFACSDSPIRPKRMLWLLNVGASTITLKHDDAGSDADKRIINPNGVDYPLDPGRQAFLFYAGAWNLFA